MQVANRESFAVAARRRGWKNPYVTDGLIAMWDGEWNAGGGVHDASATTWKDIAGQNDVTLHNTTFSSAAALFNGTSSYGTMSVSSSVRNTLEACISDVTQQNGVIVLLGGAAPSVSIALGVAEGGRNFGYYVRSDARGRQTASLPAGITSFRAGTYSTAFDKSSGTEGSAVGRYNARSCLNGSSFLSYANSQGYIGRRESGWFYKGNVHCIRIYNRLLSAGELDANYSIDRERFNPS